MILADSNIWIDFFRGKTHTRFLSELITEKRVVLHPWVLGEVMIGDFGSRREEVFGILNLLPRIAVHSIEELIDFIGKEKLFGKGLSVVDVQLIYSSLLSDCLIWTLDKQLASVAKHYKKAYSAL